MDRTLFTGGPGDLLWDSTTIQMEDDTWRLTVEDVVVNRTTNLHGKVGASKDYSIGRLRFTPVGTTANISELFTKFFGPFQPSKIGSLLFPGTDKPAVIRLRSGQTVTLAAAMVTRPPSVRFVANENIFGEMEMTVLIENETDGTGAGDFVTIGSSSYTEPTFNPLQLIATPWAVAWGSTPPFDEIEVSREGLVFEVVPQLSEKLTNNAGLLNYRLDGVEASVRFTPVNVDVDDFLGTMMLLDNSLARGQMVAGRGEEFTIEGANTGDPTLTIGNAVPVDPVDINVGRVERIGQVTLQAHRASSGGDLYTLGVVSGD